MEELRSKHKSIQNAAHHIAFECIHPQDGRTHGTPNESPILGRALCLTPRGSPVPGRVSHLNDKFQDSLTLTSDTEALVAKISAMFPTVSETHIKILLKKYYNREAVVISALQVEKHPITTPGPLSMSPLTARLPRGACSALHLARGASSDGHFTPLTTPHGSPSLFRPASGASSYGGTKSIDGQPRHQSPKMKLKYLKSVFPKAEETLILDVLANKDNNVQKASEELIHMGFTKKETNLNPQKKEKETPQPPKKVTIMKTAEEKEKFKQMLIKKYHKIPERLVGIALESVDYHEDRVEQILGAVLQEEESPKMVPMETREVRATAPKAVEKGITVAESEPSPPPAPAARRLKTWADRLKPILKPSSNAETKKYKSQYRGASNGPNTTLRQGPKDSLLLLDYLPWNGPNPEYRGGQTVQAEGPESRVRPLSAARGATTLAKGPAGIAVGSMYKINKKSAKVQVCTN